MILVFWILERKTF